MSDQEAATFTVLRTSDAKRQEITILLSKTLQQLKEVLGEKKHFGPLSGKNSRIFYMGRELKSGGRSLSKLGLGRFNNHILHLHVTSEPGANTERTGNAGKVVSTNGRRRNRTTNSMTTSGVSSSIAATTSSTHTSNSNRSMRNPSTSHFKDDSVIEILSDSDDEQEIIAFSAGAAGKRRRMS